MSSVRARKYAGGIFWEGWYSDANGKWRGFNTKIPVHGKTSEKAAEELVAWKQMEIQAGRNSDKPQDGRVKAPTIGMIGDAWIQARGDQWSLKTAQNRRDSLRKAEGFFKDRVVGDITGDVIRDYRRELRKTISPATVNSKLTDLYALLTFAREQGHAAPKPRRDFLDQPTRNDDYLTEDELTAVLTASETILLNGQSLRPFFEFCVLTGMRRGEVLKCAREWMRDGIFFIPGWLGGVRVTKNGKSRRVPVSPALRELLTHLPQRGRLFPDMTEEVSRKFQVAIKLCGIERKLKLHNLRDTFVTMALRNRMDLRAIKEIVGDEFGTLFRHYAAISEEDLKASIR